MNTATNVANIPIWQNLNKENLEGEIWKDVKGYEGLYKVSNLGRVKTTSRIAKRQNKKGDFNIYPVKEKIKKPYQTKSGYVTIAIVLNNKTITTYLHRIVAEAFVERKSESDIVVNHINGIKNDNRIDNLEWVTSSDNNIHALDTSLRTTRKYMSSETIYKILELRKNGFKNTQIAKELNLTEIIVQGVTSGKTYKRLQTKV